MKPEKIVIALALLSLFPLSALAQDVSNVDLANRLVGQQIHDAAAGLQPGFSGSLFGLSKRQKKLARAKYREFLKMAAVQNSVSTPKTANADETISRENATLAQNDQ